MCTDMRIDLCTDNVYRHAHRHVYRYVYRYVHRHVDWLHIRCASAVEAVLYSIDFWSLSITVVSIQCDGWFWCQTRTTAILNALGYKNTNALGYKNPNAEPSASFYVRGEIAPSVCTDMSVTVTRNGVPS